MNSRKIGRHTLSLGSDRKTFRVEGENRRGICAGTIRNGTITLNQFDLGVSLSEVAACLREMSIQVDACYFAPAPKPMPSKAKRAARAARPAAPAPARKRPTPKKS